MPKFEEKLITMNGHIHGRLAREARTKVLSFIYGVILSHERLKVLSF